jgi:hypothetical protein
LQSGDIPEQYLIEVKRTQNPDVWDQITDVKRQAGNDGAKALDLLMTTPTLRSLGWWEQIMVTLGRTRRSTSDDTWTLVDKMIFVVGYGPGTNKKNAKGDIYEDSVISFDIP